MIGLPVGGWLWENLGRVGEAGMASQGWGLWLIAWGLWLIAQALRYVGPYDPRTWQAAEAMRLRRRELNLRRRGDHEVPTAAR